MLYRRKLHPKIINLGPGLLGKFSRVFGHIVPGDLKLCLGQVL